MLTYSRLGVLDGEGGEVGIGSPLRVPPAFGGHSDDEDGREGDVSGGGDSDGRGGGGGGAARSAWRADHPNLAHHKLDASEKRRMAAFESLDFDLSRNEPHRRARRLAAQRPREQRQRALFEWAVFAAIGLVTGTAGFWIDAAVGSITRGKFAVVNALLRQPSGGGGGGDGDGGGGVLAALDMLLAFVALAALNIALAAAAAAVVTRVEPAAGGSGIPEVKGYLNGTNYPRLLALRTLGAKMAGVVAACSSGLLIGKEGPLIHIGAIVAANLAHLPRLRRLLPHAEWPLLFRYVSTRSRLVLSRSFFYLLTHALLLYLFPTRRASSSNDRVKRDFVSAGAAAGVAAAFGAPIGGVLFALEEASSFWSVPLTWRVFFCAMLGAFSLHGWQVWLEGRADFGGLLSFGAPDRRRRLYELWELPVFLALGALGGVLGAAFCACNQRLSRWRRARLLHRPRLRLLEAVALAAATSVFTFGLPVFFSGSCAPLPASFNVTGAAAAADAADAAATDAAFTYERFACAEGEYNGVATVAFTSNGAAIRALFHDGAVLPPAALALYVLGAFPLAAATYGSAVPSGLFVPCILIGAALGRLWGELMRLWYAAGAGAGAGPAAAAGAAAVVNAPTYALVGAVAMLGGVTRITICLTVIMVETTVLTD